MRQGCVVLADKHPNVLGGIRRLLEAEVETVVMVADEISLRQVLEHFDLDMVVADLSLPVSTNSNIARELKKHFPQTKVIILSMHDDMSVVDEVMALVEVSDDVGLVGAGFGVVLSLEGPGGG